MVNAATNVLPNLTISLGSLFTLLAGYIIGSQWVALLG